MSKREIGLRIARLRASVPNLTQHALAVRLGVRAQQVSRWETGLVAPDTDNIAALARFFGVSTDALLGVPATPAAPEQP